jgi:hypothetical protein
MTVRYWVYGGVGVTALSIAVLLFSEFMNVSDGRLWHLGPFLGSCLITIGWIVTSEVNIRNSRKQHTIGMINQHRFGAIREKNLSAILKKLPSQSSRLTIDLIDFDIENDEFLMALDAELNFYDFAAAAVERNDVDEALLQACLQNQLLNLYDQTELYILHWRKKNSSTWCYMAAMRDRWKNKPIKVKNPV